MASEVKDELQPQQSYIYSRKKLYFSAVIASSIYVGVGLIMGWPSPALILLENRNFTSNQRTLLASLPGLAPGPLITMFGIDSIGRKYTLFIIWSTVMISWIIMCISENINALLVARFIGGWGMAAAFSAIGIYNSEISDVEVRGSLNSMSMIFLTIGSIIVSSVGPFTSFECLTFVSAAASLVFGLLFWMLPESPYYYINKKQVQKARSTLTWLRTNAVKEDIEDELSKIQLFIEEEKKNKVGFRKLCSSKTVFKQFAVAGYILFMQQLSGLGPLLSYFLPIFKSANLSFDAAYIPIALNIVSLFAGIPTLFLVKKFGNKIIFICSGFVAAFGHSLLALFFLLQEGKKDVSSITWLPILAATLLVIMIYLGMGGLVWAVVSDLFPTSVKGYATGICGIFSTFLGFVSNEVFGLSNSAFMFGRTFLGFAIANFIFSFGLFFIPNVTHMTLQEIQDLFEGNSKEKSSAAKDPNVL